MIAIMTWNEELNEELREGLNGSNIINSFEELTQNMDKFNEVILSKHQSWTLELLESVLESIKILGKKIYYIARPDNAEETKLLVELNIKNILWEPIDAEGIISEVKFSDIKDLGLFDDDDLYDNEPVDVTIKEELEEDVIKNEKVAEIKTAEPVAIEAVQPVVTVKQESTFRFLLNWVLKILSLPVTLIGLIIENIGWILLMGLISVILTGVFFVLNKQGISTSEFMDEVFNLISDIIAKFKQ